MNHLTRTTMQTAINAFEKQKTVLSQSCDVAMNKKTRTSLCHVVNGFIHHDLFHTYQHRTSRKHHNHCIFPLGIIVINISTPYDSFIFSSYYVVFKI